MKRNERAFVNTVWKHYEKDGRHDLAWRLTTNPYRIAVSEVMLQQTQVGRVKEKYAQFMKLFPTVRSLAKASLCDVLAAWSGLGYNRRAKFLKSMAETVTNECKGTFPKTVHELEALPGVGHYTARAIATFAYNTPDTFIETNIRTVYMYHFFPDAMKDGGELVNDKVLMPIIEATLDTKNPREWYWALMDYGSYLKNQGVRINKKSTHYVKQKAFIGSVREVRGAIIKILPSGPLTRTSLRAKTGFDDERFETALTQLIAEKLIEKKGNKFQISD